MSLLTTTPIDCGQSLAMQQRAQHCIPGMTQLLSKHPNQFAPGYWPGYFSKAKGVHVWDLDGNRYVDMSIGGIGANVLGYADDEVDQAVCNALRKGVSSSLNCAEEVELAELLCSLHPWASRVRLARSGGEAAAMAVRIARAHTGRDKIAFCGYHGWHDWYLSANLGTEDALGGHLLSGLDPAGVPKCLEGTAHPFRYNQLDELEEIVAKTEGQLAAIVMEPIRNEPPKPGFLESVRNIATEHGLVLIFDEISAGFRMNPGGAHLTLGMAPDIALFAKAIGNGYAIAAVIGTAEVMDSVSRTFISSTNWTERIGPTAAITTIKKHQRLDVGKRLVTIGQLVQQGWQKIADTYQLPIQVSGIPPMSHFRFRLPNHLLLKATFVRKMLQRGFLASTSFYAMHAHSEAHVEQYLSATDEVFEELTRLAHQDSTVDNPSTLPSSDGFKRLN